MMLRLTAMHCPCQYSLIYLLHHLVSGHPAVLHSLTTPGWMCTWSNNSQGGKCGDARQPVSWGVGSFPSTDSWANMTEMSTEAINSFSLSLEPLLQHYHTINKRKYKWITKIQHKQMTELTSFLVLFQSLLPFCCLLMVVTSLLYPHPSGPLHYQPARGLLPPHGNNNSPCSSA